MKFGYRSSSVRKSFSSRTSPKKFVRSKSSVPNGAGFITNPKKATYNWFYNRTTTSIRKPQNWGSVLFGCGFVVIVIFIFIWAIGSGISSLLSLGGNTPTPSSIVTPTPSTYIVNSKLQAITTNGYLGSVDLNGKLNYPKYGGDFKVMVNCYDGSLYGCTSTNSRIYSINIDQSCEGGDNPSFSSCPHGDGTEYPYWTLSDANTICDQYNPTCF